MEVCTVPACPACRSGRDNLSPAAVKALLRTLARFQYELVARWNEFPIQLQRLLQRLAILDPYNYPRIVVYFHIFPLGRLQFQGFVCDELWELYQPILEREQRDGPPAAVAAGGAAQPVRRGGFGLPRGLAAQYAALAVPEDLPAAAPAPEPDPADRLESLRRDFMATEKSPYMAEMLAMIRDDNVVPYREIMDYWNGRLHRWRRLAAIFYLYAVVPASSASSERVFSQAGRVLNKTRNRMSAETLSNHLLLVCNPELLFQATEIDLPVIAGDAQPGVIEAEDMDALEGVDAFEEELIRVNAVVQAAALEAAELPRELPVVAADEDIVFDMFF